jgi:hypothetical protein
MVSCWKGKANEACGTVFQRIHTVVTGLRKDHDQEKAGLSFHMYMMGKAKSCASLLLVVCSTSVEKRKRFMKLIKKNGVLDGLPPIKLGHALSPIALARAEPRTSNTAQDMPTANTPPANEWVSIPSGSSEPTASLSSHLQPSLSPSAGSRIHSNFGRLSFRPITKRKLTPLEMIWKRTPGSLPREKRNKSLRAAWRPQAPVCRFIKLWGFYQI